MNEGEKQCGLASFIPMSCRGRAEAFARRLHNRLRSLGSQDGGSDPTSESSWLAANEISNSNVTNRQPRHSGTENDIFMDFGIFETPGSPDEELTEHELSKFITNPKDDLHHLNLDECGCIAGKTCEINKRNSLDSDSSDGQYFDPDNGDLEQQNGVLNHVNGVSSNSTDNHISEDVVTDSSNIKLNSLSEVCNKINEVKLEPSVIPSSSECTLSSLSQHASEDDLFDDTLTETELNKASDIQTTSGWCLNFDTNKVAISNNNIYGAIDLESLKSNVEEKKTPNLSSLKNETNPESYCSHFEIHHDLTVECPCSNSKLEISTLEITDKEENEDKETNEIEGCKCPDAETCVISPPVEISTYEIEDIDKNEAEASIPKEELECLCNNESIQNKNLLKVEECVENGDEIEVEERTPRVRRCSSLKTGKTPPGTPGRKKIVRFADVLGLDLADVRTFLDEIPKVPISAYEDLSGVDLSLSDASLSSNSGCLDSVHASVKTLVPLFQQPGGEPDFMDKVKNNLVCLENAVVKDTIALCVCGTVRVRNLDFHKSVHIRYTLDQWKSFADMQATYIDNSCDGFSDKFSFTLYVHTLTVGQRLEFAVRFQCKGCQYWDNNAGENYCFTCMPNCTNSSYAPITTPDDTTWAGAAFY